MREKIKLVSSAGTGHYYTTDKNKRTTPDKLEFKKYDPVIRKHVLYTEAKSKERACHLGWRCPNSLKSKPLAAASSRGLRANASAVGKYAIRPCAGPCRFHQGYETNA